MAKQLRWGILAPGRIAHKFATGLAAIPDGTVFAVGSRAIDRAREFARQYGADRAYGSYQELAADPDVDAIYIATLTSGVRTYTANSAYVFGSDGYIEIPEWFFMSPRAFLHRGEEREEWHEPFMANGYEYQAIEVARCLEAGAVESHIMPRSESLRIIRTLDAIRAQWGLVYPFE